MRSLPLILFLSVLGMHATSVLRAESKPNVLIVTVDDMSCDSVGAFGCQLPSTTPNIDALAKSALRFQYAHVQVGNCMPSRNVMWSGRFPHNNGVEGFYQVPNASYPVLCDLAKKAGYFTAIRHKISHSTPYTPYEWDLELDVAPDGTKRHIKDAESYGDSTRQAIAAAEEAEKPFCVMINVSDPHKPFYTQVKGGRDPHVPSLIFKASEVPTPGFLPEDPIIRQELALYYSSVRRADDCVGEVLQALEESGHEQDTFVLFLSDHGMPLPFAKTQLYHHSTHTPLIIRWPSVTKAATIDREHMVSAVDFIPTLAEVMQFETPGDLDGRSFAELLRGESQAGRDFVVKEYNENSGAKRNPMRAIQTKEYLYLFNPWSNGELKMATATNGTQTWKRMKQLAAEDDTIAKRVDLMEHRVVEELYHVARDPECLMNVVHDPDHQEAASKLRGLLRSHMESTNDPVASLLDERANPAALQKFMDRQQAAADARRSQRKARNRNPNAKTAASSSRGKKYFTWKVAGEKEGQIQVVVSYDFPASETSTPLIVTLKSATNQRLQRKQEQIEGSGEAKFWFQLPKGQEPNDLKLAAYIGVDFQHAWQYETDTLSALADN